MKDVLDNQLIELVVFWLLIRSIVRFMGFHIEVVWENEPLWYKLKCSIRVLNVIHTTTKKFPDAMGDRNNDIWGWEDTEIFETHYEGHSPTPTVPIRKHWIEIFVTTRPGQQCDENGNRCLQYLDQARAKLIRFRYAILLDPKAKTMEVLSGVRSIFRSKLGKDWPIGVKVCLSIAQFNMNFTEWTWW